MEHYCIQKLPRDVLSEIACKIDNFSDIVNFANSVLCIRCLDAGKLLYLKCAGSIIADWFAKKVGKDRALRAAISNGPNMRGEQSRFSCPISGGESSVPFVPSESAIATCRLYLPLDPDEFSSCIGAAVDMGRLDVVDEMMRRADNLIERLHVNQGTAMACKSSDGKQDRNRMECKDQLKRNLTAWMKFLCDRSNQVITSPYSVPRYGSQHHNFLDVMLKGASRSNIFDDVYFKDLLKGLLCLATYKGDANVVRVLLHHGADPRCYDGSPLINASAKEICKGASDIVTLLFTHCPDLDVMSKNGAAIGNAVRSCVRAGAKAYFGSGRWEENEEEATNRSQVVAVLVDRMQNQYSSLINVMLIEVVDRALDASIEFTDVKLLHTLLKRDIFSRRARACSNALLSRCIDFLEEKLNSMDRSSQDAKGQFNQSMFRLLDIMLLLVQEYDANLTFGEWRSLERLVCFVENYNTSTTWGFLIFKNKPITLDKFEGSMWSPSEYIYPYRNDCWVSVKDASNEDLYLEEKHRLHTFLWNMISTQARKEEEKNKGEERGQRENEERTNIIRSLCDIRHMDLLFRVIKACNVAILDHTSKSFSSSSSNSNMTVLLQYLASIPVDISTNMVERLLRSIEKDAFLTKYAPLRFLSMSLTSHQGEKQMTRFRFNMYISRSNVDEVRKMLGNRRQHDLIFCHNTCFSNTVEYNGDYIQYILRCALRAFLDADVDRTLDCVSIIEIVVEQIVLDRCIYREEDFLQVVGDFMTGDIMKDNRRSPSFDPAIPPNLIEWMCQTRHVRHLINEIHRRSNPKILDVFWHAVQRLVKALFPATAQFRRLALSTLTHVVRAHIAVRDSHRNHVISETIFASIFDDVFTCLLRAFFPFDSSDSGRQGCSIVLRSLRQILSTIHEFLKGGGGQSHVHMQNPASGYMLRPKHGWSIEREDVEQILVLSSLFDFQNALRFTVRYILPSTQGSTGNMSPPEVVRVSLPPPDYFYDAVCSGPEKNSMRAKFTKSFRNCSWQWCDADGKVPLGLWLVLVATCSPGKQLGLLPRPQIILEDEQGVFIPKTDNCSDSNNRANIQLRKTMYSRYRSMKFMKITR